MLSHGRQKAENDPSSSFKSMTGSTSHRLGALRLWLLSGGEVTLTTSEYSFLRTWASQLSPKSLRTELFQLSDTVDSTLVTTGGMVFIPASLPERQRKETSAFQRKLEGREGKGQIIPGQEALCRKRDFSVLQLRHLIQVCCQHLGPFYVVVPVELFILGVGPIIC